MCPPQFYYQTLSLQFLCLRYRRDLFCNLWCTGHQKASADYSISLLLVYRYAVLALPTPLPLHLLLLKASRAGLVTNAASLKVDIILLYLGTTVKYGGFVNNYASSQRLADHIRNGAGQVFQLYLVGTFRHDADERFRTGSPHQDLPVVT